MREPGGRGGGTGEEGRGGRWRDEGEEGEGGKREEERRKEVTRGGRMMGKGRRGGGDGEMDGMDEECRRPAGPSLCPREAMLGHATATAWRPCAPPNPHPEANFARALVATHCPCAKLHFLHISVRRRRAINGRECAVDARSIVGESLPI